MCAAHVYGHVHVHVVRRVRLRDGGGRAGRGRLRPALCAHLGHQPGHLPRLAELSRLVRPRPRRAGV
eukprot:scaffold142468_cov142-Phaeocystis_antarctica.AAC.1